MAKSPSFLLMVQVYQEQCAEDVLVALTEAGVKDIFSLSGVNESRRLPQNIPLFAGFKNLMGKTSSVSKIFFGIVEDDEVPKIVLASLKHADIDFLGDDFGMMALFPLAGVYVPAKSSRAR